MGEPTYGDRGLTAAQIRDSLTTGNQEHIAIGPGGAIASVIADLLDERRRLRAALGYYAEPTLYAVTQAAEPRSAAHDDKGYIARVALGTEERRRTGRHPWEFEWIAD